MSPIPCVIVLMFYQVVEFSCFVPRDRPSCTYPKGSITCKVWNHTNVDCSFRELVCIPSLPQDVFLEFVDLSHIQLSTIPDYAFNQLNMLQSLDLSFNSILSIQGRAFIGLQDLLKLDMSHNSIFALTNNGFNGLPELQSLDLSWNSISFITDDAFNDLNELKLLDLKGNKLRNITGSFFEDLSSLKDINLKYNDLSVVSNATFVGLQNLQKLDISLYNLDDIESTIFTGLTSLLSLNVDVNGPLADCEKIEKIVNGLNKLQDLTLISRIKKEICSTYDISLLLSLRSLYLDGCNVNITEKLVKTIPIKYLYYRNDLPDSPPYKMMRHLTDLEIASYSDMRAAVQNLQSLASPLESLTLTLHSDVAIELDTLTFEACRVWNATLQKLQVFCSSKCQDIVIEGSPFMWFPNLQILRMQGNEFGGFIIQTLSDNTFNGLNNLRELYLNRLNTNVFRSGALRRFHSYQSLQVLDLSDNQMNGEIDTEQLCAISSLQKLKLSHNNSLLLSLRSLYLDGCNVNITEKLVKTIPIKYLYYRNDLPDSPPYKMMRHLTDLEIASYSDMRAAVQNLQSLASPLESLTLTLHSDVAIELDTLTFEACRVWNATLQKLQVFCSSKCQDIVIEGSPFMWFPNLQILRMQGNEFGGFIIQTLSDNTFNGLNNLRELYLNRLNTNVFRSGALRRFHSYQSLQVLDLSDNQMNGEIDTEQLCAISSLQKLKLSHNNSLLLSLRSLYLDGCNVNITEKLVKTIPIKYLYYRNDLPDSPPYKIYLAF